MATGTVQQMFVGGDWQPSATGETFDATSPATGELIGAVPQGDRDDARRAIAAARDAADGWARLTAFERAAKMHAVGDIIESRRDELARTLTLDQGKPLRAEAFDEVDELVEYWRMAAEDCKRLGGELPNSFSPGKRVMLVRRPRGVVGVISPWNWPYTMPAELIAPGARVRQRGRVDAGADRPRSARSRWRGASPTPTCPRASSTSSPGPGRSSATRSPGIPDVDGVAFIGSTATGRLVAQARGRQGGRCSRWAATVRSSCSTTPTSRPPSTRRWSRCYLCAGQSCTAGERILVHGAVRDEFVELLAARGHRAHLLGDPFDDATTMGPLNNEPVAAKMDEHVADAVARGATVVSGGARADGFPTDLLYWQADGARRRAGRRAGRRRGDVRADRAGRRRSTRSSRRSRWPTPRPTGCWRRSSPPTSPRARVRRPRPHRLGEHQRVEQLLGGHLPFGGRAGTRQRHRPRRRRARDAVVHRAADGRAQPTPARPPA